MTLVSFERYLAVCKPLVHLKLHNKGRSVKMVICVWIFACLVGGSSAPGKGNLLSFCLQWPDDPKYDALPVTLHQCLAMGTGKVHEVFTVVPEVVEFVSFVVALIANSFFYTFIIHALSSRSVMNETGKDTQTIQIRNQVARTLIINGVVFFITQMPYRLKNINVFVESITGTALFSKSLADNITVVGRGGLFLNSSVNSFIYAFSSPFYRDGFREALGGVFCRQREKEIHSHSAATETSVTKLQL